MNNKELYKDIRKQSKIEFKRGMLAAHFLTRDIGRLCSVWFIRYGVIPNQITILMIIFGIVGSLLFAIPNVWCKIAGYISWLLWFAMDCSDGQVARYTKTFSKYGTEMDYMAHLIDHPLMNIALWMTFIEMNVWNPILISFIFLISISCEMYMRNCFTFDLYLNRDIKKGNKAIPIHKSFVKYLYQQLNLYPTLIILFPPILIVDYVIESNFAIYIYIIWLVVFVFNTLYYYVNRLKLFYKNS